MVYSDLRNVIDKFGLTMFKAHARWGVKAPFRQRKLRNRSAESYIVASSLSQQQLYSELSGDDETQLP